MVSSTDLRRTIDRLKMTRVQRAILQNVAAGKSFDAGRPFGNSAAGGWLKSFQSCCQRGWISEGKVTAEGRIVAGLDQA